MDCMKRLTVDAVFSAVEEVLAAGGLRRGGA
jgi:hypothetical protein